MHVESLRKFCHSLPHTTEDFPFGEEVMVFRVGGKIYLLISLDAATQFNVKCDPDLAVELREKYEEVQPGYHMNKKHWNTVHLDGRLTDKQIREMIQHSYELIFASLPKSIRTELAG